MNKKNIKFAVMGSGNSGHAFAAGIALKGYPIRLGNLPELSDRINTMVTTKRIMQITKGEQNTAKLDCVTADPKVLIEEASVIFVASTPGRYESFVKALAPHFKDGQFIVFISNFGALRFRKLMHDMDIKTNVTPVEMMSLHCAARMIEPGTVKILAKKTQLPVAAMPGQKTKKFIKMVSDIFGIFTASENILTTSLGNFDPVIKPALAIINKDKIESCKNKRWNIFAEGMTRPVSRIIEGIDAERMAILKKAGISKILSTNDSLISCYREYKLQGESVADTLRTSSIHSKAQSLSPECIFNRYISEPVSFGLVPWSSIGQMWDVPTPAIDLLIHIASVISNTDYRKNGITVADLGIKGLSPREVKSIIQ